ncbi:hypothetical protein H5410_049558 [Solanum commersonii]|uniref:Uncharacterized protein n=1 Tax=Solanum commersonii TaxID=4109 RepID=A0A9J5WSS1_SOLCO|nr:hypothetical protein H5410_049558 [Solanum commersonii]
MQCDPCPREEVGDPHIYSLPLEYASWRSQVRTKDVDILLSRYDRGDCRQRLLTHEHQCFMRVSLDDDVLQVEVLRQGQPAMYGP